MPPKRVLTEAEKEAADQRRKALRAERDRQRNLNLTTSQKAKRAANEKNRVVNMTPEQRQVYRTQHTASSSRSRQTAMQSAINQTQQSTDVGTFNEKSIDQHNCGDLDVKCQYCGAKHFKKEAAQDKKFTTCCQKGKVVLPPIRTTPLIEQLLKRQHVFSENFMQCIRQMNSSLAFASMGANLAPPPGYGPYCFRINGQIYHRTGALHPSNGDDRKYAQLYILDPDKAANQRMMIRENAQCNADLMQELSTFMAENNPFAKAFKMLYQVEQECKNEALLNGAQPKDVQMSIVQDRKSDKRRYNLPTVNEVAIVFKSADGAPPVNTDILIHCKANPGDPNYKRTERINILNPNLEPMVYPLFFPYGDQSWGINIPLTKPAPTLNNLRQTVVYELQGNSAIPENNEQDALLNAEDFANQNEPNLSEIMEDFAEESNVVSRNVRNKAATKPRTRVTQMQFYGYRLSIRDEFNAFLCGGRLTQQYLVDAYCKTEANRLFFIRKEQSKLRVEQYTHLMDYLASEAAAQGISAGRAIILPSSFQGSPRNMTQNYQDAMAIVRHNKGKPDYFITMTCNPKWPEIIDNLEEGQTTDDRPDLVARVFKLKLDELMDDLCKRNILGTPTAKVHVIEFQKRGLPHAHILLMVKPEDKPKNAEAIDKIISAEIPDINDYPRLHAIVTKHMVHGPCGIDNPKSPCWDGKKCTKGFPKDFQSETSINGKGYPKYRRNDTARAMKKGKVIDNRWIVPYNRYLALKYNCHINVESCASVQSVKYLYKYIYKGHDCANIKITEYDTLNHDEIEKFQNSRYVSAPEAAWRLFGYHMHEQSHTIVRLPVHLPEQQSVVFTEDTIEQAVESAPFKDTMLLAWFKLNQTDLNAREHLYVDIPKHYVFQAKQKCWTPRQRGHDKTIGRMYSVSLKADPERYCLRLLLLHVPGATSFENLRTIDGHMYPSFKEAAQKLGVFDDDKTWDLAMEEAAVFKMPAQLRDMFAFICSMEVLSSPAELFEKYKSDLTEDFSRHDGHVDNDCIHCQNLALREIDETLRLHGKSCKDVKLPIPPSNMVGSAEEYFDILSEQQKGDSMQSTLNVEQKAAFDAIMTAAESDNLPERCFFMDGVGGSGKTHVYKTLLSTVRGEGNVAIPVASTGIAANLLEGGRTYHSQFGVPVDLNETQESTIKMTSNDAKLIRKAKLLIWDESTMAPSMALSLVDRLLKNIMKSVKPEYEHKPFGGKVLLLGGDFRQTLPIVPHGHRSDIIEASLKFNEYWDKFKILHLKSNVRSVDPEFSEWLVNLGDGKLTNSHGLSEDIIEIPAKFICNDSIVKEIFGEHLSPETVESFSKMAILCPKNVDVDNINDEVLELLDGENVQYLSRDTIIDKTGEDTDNYPVEFLNEQTPSGMPLSKLRLKIGSIIILLRNLNTKRGLCNGTRLIVKNLKPNLVIAQVLTGSAEKQMVFIPRIDMIPTNTDLPFKINRRQFPIKVAFAMTINKSQGQTLEKVGVYLPEPVFGHGQLYVALSRVRRSEDVKIKILDGSEQGKLLKNSDAIFTKNVVYKEIFDT